MPRLHPLLQAAVAVLVGLVVAGIAYVVVSGADEEYEARARGALTEEVVWPFFDAVRETQSVRLEDPVAEQSVDQAAGEPVELSVELPRSQVFIDITAVGSTGSSAAAGADAALALIITADTAELTATAQEELDLASDRLAALGVPETDGGRSEADRLVRLVTDLELQLANVQPRIRVLESAEVPVDPTRDPIRLAAIAGLIAAFVTFVFLRWATPRSPVQPPRTEDGLVLDPEAGIRSLAEHEQAAVGRST